MLIDTEEPYKCCNEEWEFEQQQLLNSQGDCVRALCIKCGAYLEVLQGQVDEEELENYRQEEYYKPWKDITNPRRPDNEDT